MARLSRTFALVAVGATLAATDLLAQAPALGDIDFPTSAMNAQAISQFERGVLLLHSFEYEDAANAFRAAQELEPGFVMAYWGEALTYNHPIWMEQDRDAAVAALARLADTPDARLAMAPTNRERGYLRAVETLYGTIGQAQGADKHQRDFLYRDAMRRLHQAFPDDREATAFYALSILGTAHEGRDFATYMRAAALVEPVFEANKSHPGAAHYLIHSYDDPIHAPLGLPMARAYSKIAPAAAHAQHMTSHIFVATGMWDDVVVANEVARDVQNARQARLDRRPVVCGHYTYWLEYGYLQQGRFDDAKQVMDTCYERIQSDPNQSELGYFASMRARYVMDTGEWAAADAWVADFGTKPNWNYEVVSAGRALVQGDTATAQAIHAKMLAALDGVDSPSQLHVLERELAGVMMISGGEVKNGLAALKDAARLEAEMPFEFGPPFIVKPTQELLGDFYTVLDMPAEAASAFKEQLAHTPGRTNALLGLARASSALGDDVTAMETFSDLAKIWHSADAGIPGLDEVRRASATDGSN